jgi:hypothetical protein
MVFVRENLFSQAEITILQSTYQQVFASIGIGATSPAQQLHTGASFKLPATFRNSTSSDGGVIGMSKIGLTQRQIMEFTQSATNSAREDTDIEEFTVDGGKDASTFGCPCALRRKKAATMRVASVASHDSDDDTHATEHVEIDADYGVENHVEIDPDYVENQIGEQSSDEDQAVEQHCDDSDSSDNSGDFDEANSNHMQTLCGCRRKQKKMTTMCGCGKKKAVTTMCGCGRKKSVTTMCNCGRKTATVLCGCQKNKVAVVSKVSEEYQPVEEHCDEAHHIEDCDIPDCPCKDHVDSANDNNNNNTDNINNVDLSLDNTTDEICDCGNSLDNDHDHHDKPCGCDHTLDNTIHSDLAISDEVPEQTNSDDVQIYTVLSADNTRQFTTMNIDDVYQFTAESRVVITTMLLTSSQTGVSQANIMSTVDSSTARTAFSNQLLQNLSLRPYYKFSGISSDGTVLPSHCTNNQLDADQNESDIDCGGPCDKCNLGLYCNSGDDCESGHCAKQNGQERKTCANSAFSAQISLLLLSLLSFIIFF